MAFEWDPKKDASNQAEHRVTFSEAQNAFRDPERVVRFDSKHSTGTEKRYFCFGWVNGAVLTVRFTVRGGRIRIFGAGYWREGRRYYEEKGQV